jgi:transposase
MKEAAFRQYRKYSPEFKRQAVENWLASGKSAETIGQELGIHANRLYAWRSRFAPSAPGGKGAEGATVPELQARLAAAERELARVREQRDILKKTLGILSETPGSATNASTR